MIDPKTLHPTELYKINKTAQWSVILIAAFEYFASILISGAFLASLLTKIGVSDSVAGITASLASFGSLTQFIALFLSKGVRSAKKLVSTTHVIAQLLLVTLYLVPFVQVPQTVKTALFIVLYLVATFAKSIINPIRTNWNMSYVNSGERGTFTATCEIISLIGGMIFTWVMSMMMDHYEDIGRTDISFILCGITIFVLSIFILLCYLPRKELAPQAENANAVSIREALQCTMGSKPFRKLLGLDILFYIATGICAPFLGTYANNELGLSLTTISIISFVASIARTLASRPMGRFADKASWANSLMLCFAFAAAAYAFNIFTAPVNGLVFYSIYTVLYALCSAGVSGVTNIVYDYIPPRYCTGALAIKGTISGLVSFAATLVGAAIVNAVQANDNRLFGITVYAQQLLSAIACLLFAVLIFYIKYVIKKQKTIED